MDNYEIADQLSLLSKLMEIHGENAFRAKSYAIGAFALEKLPEEVSGMSQADIYRIKNIGETVGKKIIEIIETGELQQLKDLIEKTPPGVLEMLNIKGIGPKKISVLWKELKIDSIEELQKACEEHRLSNTKGFGEKTEQKILDSITFKQGAVGKFLYRQVEEFAEAFTEKLRQKFKEDRIEITGEYRRQLEVIGSLEWVTTINKEKLKKYILTETAELVRETDDVLELLLENSVTIQFYLADEKSFSRKLFETSSSAEFMEEWAAMSESDSDVKEEKDIFEEEGLNYIPPFLREKGDIIKAAERESFEDIIQVSDIKGLIHSHSNWSDGGHTIEQMAKALIDLGFEYMVISDHSKAAFYANGMNEERIKQQHLYVDELNEKFKPFKIFKSIECDILSDGRLDYEDEVLSTFDLVITSIHSNLQMAQDKAMKRLLGAITNPYTTILGHMTGRLLLRRNGYPVDHKTIIDACAENHVVIEINANPNRLDMDWRFIDYALEKNVLLSIDPDAHTVGEFPLIKYGVLVAQKGGLPSRRNLSSYSLKEFEKYLADTKKLKGIG